MYWVPLSPETGEFHFYHGEDGFMHRCARPKTHVEEWMKHSISGEWEARIIETLLDADGALIDLGFRKHSWYEAKMQNKGYQKGMAIILSFEDEQDAAKFKLFWV
jgi:hypothetical protein